MTPALKAVVEAMAETEADGLTLRQTLQAADGEGVGPRDVEAFLEQVARAGLAAASLQSSLDYAFDPQNPAPSARRQDVGLHFRRVIDGILKDA